MLSHHTVPVFGTPGPFVVAHYSKNHMNVVCTSGELPHPPISSFSAPPNEDVVISTVRSVIHYQQRVHSVRAGRHRLPSPYAVRRGSAVVYVDGSGSVFETFSSPHSRRRSAVLNPTVVSRPDKHARGPGKLMGRSLRVSGPGGGWWVWIRRLVPHSTCPPFLLRHLLFSGSSWETHSCPC